LTQQEELAELQQTLSVLCGLQVEMYVGERSIRLVALYLYAWADGRSHGTSLNLCQYIRLFAAWLAIRNKSASSVGWDRTLLDSCQQNDERALQEAPRLFAEFIAECGDFSKKDWFNRFGPFMRPWSEPQHR
jgi:hypothetical protein